MLVAREGGSARKGLSPRGLHRARHHGRPHGLYKRYTAKNTWDFSYHYVAALYVAERHRRERGGFDTGTRRPPGETGNGSGQKSVMIFPPVLGLMIRLCSMGSPTGSLMTFCICIIRLRK